MARTKYDVYRGRGEKPVKTMVGRTPSPIVKVEVVVTETLRVGSECYIAPSDGYAGIVEGDVVIVGFWDSDNLTKVIPDIYAPTEGMLNTAEELEDMECDSNEVKIWVEYRYLRPYNNMESEYIPLGLFTAHIK
jgi:hypothetical protein